MFRSITFNGTDKKPIGDPIIRKTNEMIYEFDLQYERNYKIVKVISQREREFQEYLKQQEELQFRLKNLIKILKAYFEENNYNSNTYYEIFKFQNRPVNRMRRRRKRRHCPKSEKIRRTKNIFYKITKNYFYFNKFKPYLYPLTIKDKKNYERKIFTDPNLRAKNGNNLSDMTPAQLKKFVDVFGFVPMVFKNQQEKKNKNKKLKKKRNFSSNNLFSNTKRKENKIKLKMKKDNNVKFLGSDNRFNLNNSNSYFNLINNYYSKGSQSESYKNSKNIQLNNYYYRYNNPNNNSQGTTNSNNNISNINPSNSYNNIYYYNRYINLKNFNIKGNQNYSILNNNLSSNKSSLSNNTIYNNNIFRKNNNNIPSVIRIKKNANMGSFRKSSSSLKNKCIKTIQKSEVLNKDIKSFNKINKLYTDDFKNKKNEIQKKGLKKVNFINFMKIYEQDFRSDVINSLQIKFQHIKEDINGHIQLKKMEFFRKPKSKLHFVRVYNRRRDQKKANNEDFLSNNDYEIEEELYKDLTPISNKKKSLSNINLTNKVKLSRNRFNKLRYISSSKSVK